ncbi:3-keto-disaccharide hydrolase [Maribacter confluentis]|uniref:3-keto-disaccharide hydrolase n=1 Tax=Maribacter confluentis TaxID=1656093 RepID=UPI00345B608D
MGVNEDEKFKTGYQTGPEIQILDNDKHPDAKAGTTHQAGALYDMVPPAKDVTKPVGEWNTMELTVDHKNNRGKVLLNGTEMVTFPITNEEWNAMVANSKFAGWDGFGTFKTGKIGLQDHGNVVSFRNIKIKQL